MNLNSTASFLGLYKKPTVPWETYHAELWNNPNNKFILDYLRNERGLTDKTIFHFKLGATEHGEIAIPIFKDSELIDFKFRAVKEKAFRRWPASETWVFNEEGLASASETSKLIVTEGEFDVMALYQLGFRSVVSGTGGAKGRTEWINKIPDNVKQVYISGDNDEPGQEYARNLAERIGLERCYNIILPTKDANDYLKAGGTATEYKDILTKARRFDVQDVFRLGEIIDKFAKNKITRKATFSSNFNNVTNGGVYDGALIIISGRTGVGKSTAMLNYLIGHANEGRPVLLISLENDMSMTVQRLLEIKYSKPINKFSKEDWDTVKAELVDYPFYIDTSMETYSMEKIAKLVEQGKKMYGIEFLGFDHINFLPGRGANETQQLSQMSREFKVMTRQNKIITYLITHVRKVQDDKPFITGEDLKGTSSLAQDADMVLLLYNTRNGIEMAIDKARASRSHLKLPFVFDGANGTFIDDPERTVVDYGGQNYDFMEEPTSQSMDIPV